MSKINLTIELLYFDGCPSWYQACETLSRALAKLEIEQDIKLIQVETQEDAEINKFTGSPTIRVNGDELFPTHLNEYGLGCRLYPTPDGLKGWPTVEMILEKLMPAVQ